MNAASLRQVLQSELILAMKEQDRPRMMVLRSVLSAIANREAVPSTESAGDLLAAPARAEVARRQLSPQQIRLVVMDEVESRRNSAAYLGTAGRHREAAALETEVEILERYLYLT